MRGRTETQNRKKTEGSGQLSTQVLKHSWLKNAQNVAFLFGPILLTSCLRTKDTRLSAR